MKVFFLKESIGYFFKKMIATLHYVLQRIWIRIMMINYSVQFKQIGKNVIFDPLSSTFTYKTIELGKCVFIGSRAWFSGEIYIGDYVMFGPSVSILGGDHEYKNLEKPMFFVKDNIARCAPVIIEDDVWIGANVTILKGVLIRRGAIVAAGSVVNRNVEAYSIYAGIPARKVGIRFNADEQKTYHTNLDKWKQYYER